MCITDRATATAAKTDNKVNTDWHRMRNVFPSKLCNGYITCKLSWLMTRTTKSWLSLTNCTRFRISSQTGYRQADESLSRLWLKNYSSFQFSSRWYLRARKSPYELHPVSREAYVRSTPISSKAIHTLHPVSSKAICAPPHLNKLQQRKRHRKHSPHRGHAETSVES